MNEILVFYLITILEKHIDENGIHDILTVYVIQFILYYNVALCDIGTFLAVCYIFYIAYIVSKKSN